MSIRSKTSSFKEIRGLFLEGESHLAMAFIDWAWAFNNPTTRTLVKLLDTKYGKDLISNLNAYNALTIHSYLSALLLISIPIPYSQKIIGQRQSNIPDLVTLRSPLPTVEIFVRATKNLRGATFWNRGKDWSVIFMVMSSDSPIAYFRADMIKPVKLELGFVSLRHPGSNTGMYDFK